MFANLKFYGIAVLNSPIINGQRESWGEDNDNLIQHGEFNKMLCDL